MNKRDRYKGALIGLAIGDAMGTPFEFWKKDNIREHFKNNDFLLKEFERGGVNYPKGFYSDDTAMTICLAESLIEKGFDPEDQFNKYRKWLLEGYATPNNDKAYGVGQQTLKSLMKERMRKLDFSISDKRAQGNGALMRSSPIGLRYAGNYNDLKFNSMKACYVTHNSFISALSCVVYNLFISEIVQGVRKEDLIANVVKQYDGSISDPDYILETDYLSIKESDLNISGHTLDTLYISLWSFFNTDSYISSIRTVVSLGGDVDTFAAVTGSLSGAYYGYNAIPREFTTSLINAKYIEGLAEQLTT